ncbi:MAG TPA: rhodanese-like domain-containing protein [Pyrinomonadaceae bacterium]|jgi:3-mercaptopyruvate sulfurtransferase SseA|nr:rhodanese-like domain-containing protein [Pyrinomonadaceae bacterium]
MRLKFLSSAVILIAVVILAACNANDHSAFSDKKARPGAGSGPETVYADGARRVTIDELEAMMKDGTAVVIDVRNQAAYDMGHIPGSRLIPSTEILNHINELPRDKMIVTYCS